MREPPASRRQRWRSTRAASSGFVQRRHGAVRVQDPIEHTVPAGPPPTLVGGGQHGHCDTHHSEHVVQVRAAVQVRAHVVVWKRGRVIFTPWSGSVILPPPRSPSRP